MISAALVVLLSFAIDLPDEKQFAGLVAGGMEVVRDQAFVFEGEKRYVGPAGLVADDPHRWDLNFQGSFAARSDGALFLDSYARRIDPADGPLARQTGAVLGDRTEVVEASPDTSTQAPKSLTHRSPKHLAGFLGSPMRINLVWFFQPAEAVELMNFKAHGFESIDGHQCLHVEFDEIPSPRVVRSLRRHLWVDFERGSHPLRVEYHTDGRLRHRTNIKLGQVESADGKTVWFPVSGVAEEFAFAGKIYDQPMTRYHIQVVGASVRINDGLADSVFAINSQGGVADTSGLQELREAFKKQPPEPKFRTDLKGVQERLDRDLAKANQQSVQLDASSPEAQVNWTPWVQLGLAAAGATVIGLAAYLKWKRA